MSYILDALQRADAERERGHVPGLKSQIVPPASRKVEPVRRWKPVHTAAVLVALLLLLAALAWWWFARSSDMPATAPMPAPATSTAPAVTSPPAAPAVAQATPPAAVVATPAEPVQPILAPRRAEPPKPPRIAAAQIPNTAATPSSTAPPAAPASQPAARSPQATPAPLAAAAPAPAAPAPTTKDAVLIRSFAELSPEARAQLPQVNVSGSTYSQNPALRMLIINGKVLQEGQEIGPGFKLENIGPRSAVLNHQGMRYSIGY